MCNIDINNTSIYHPYRQGEHRKFVSSENNCVHIANNPNLDEVRQFKVDGEVLDDHSQEERCDYLLLNDTKKDSYYIELKGSNIPKAIAQIENTICMMKCSIQDYTVFCRIIYYTGSHKVEDQSVIRWKMKHGPRAKITSRRLEETI